MSSLNKGKIYICGEIETKTASSFLYKTDFILDKKIKKVKIYINTIGGDVPAAMAIVDKITLLKEVGVEVYTIGIGEVVSAGIFILVEGSKRYACENASFMIHPLIHELGADYHKFISKYAKFHESFYNNLMTGLAMKCGRKNPKAIGEFLRSVSDSIWLDVDEAIKFGLVEDKWTGKLEIE
jgi:ATP-dependent protease ClpP protease subunit